MSGRVFRIYCRISDATPFGLTIRSKLSFSGGYEAVSDDLAVAADGTTRLFETLSNTYHGPNEFRDLVFDADISMEAKRASGSASVTHDWIGMLLEPITKINVGTVKGTLLGFVLKGRAAHGFDTTAARASAGPLIVTGAPLEVIPEKLNVLLSILGEIGSDPVNTYTLIYKRVYVEPRWALV